LDRRLSGWLRWGARRSATIAIAVAVSALSTILLIGGSTAGLGGFLRRRCGRIGSWWLRLLLRRGRWRRGGWRLRFWRHLLDRRLRGWLLRWGARRSATIAIAAAVATLSAILPLRVSAAGPI